MANINKFSPVSPDTYLKAEKDMALAKFGHLNAIVDAYNTLDTAVTFGMPVEYISTTGLTKNNNNTLSDIPGLSAIVVSGGTYVFRVYLPVSTGATPGIKVAMAGTATWSNIAETATFYTVNNAVTGVITSGASGQSILSGTAAYLTVTIEGTVKINVGGTLTVQMSQSTSDASDTKVLPYASFIITRVA